MSNNEVTTAIDSTDKVSEYFKTKKSLKDLRADLKDLTSQHEDYEELQKMLKKVKELREKIKDEATIKELKEKASVQKERMDLLKEMIRIQLIENAEEEVKQDGKVLKLVYIVKEAKEEEKDRK